MTAEIETTVQSLVADTLKSRGIDVTPSADMSLIDSGMLDSLTIVTFVSKLEKAFDVVIETADMTLDNFDNIQLIANLIRAKRRAQ